MNQALVSNLPSNQSRSANSSTITCTVQAFQNYRFVNGSVLPSSIPINSNTAPVTNAAPVGPTQAPVTPSQGPSSSTSPSASVSNRVVETVQSGDTIYGIATSQGVTVQQILETPGNEYLKEREVNGNSNVIQIYPGDQIVIPTFKFNATSP